MGYSSVPELIRLSPTEHVFLLNEDKEIHKKAASGGGCSQTVAEHLKGGTQHLSWVCKLQAVSQL